MAGQKVPLKIQGEIATARNDVTIPWHEYIRRPQDPVLAEKGGAKGVGIYLDLLRDPHVRAVFRKRRAAVVAREWAVEPASDAPLDQQAADLFRHAIERIRFDHLCLGLNLSTLTGFAVAEIIWEVARWEGRDWILPAQIIPRNARRFVFDEDSNLRLLTRKDTFRGIALPERKFIVQVHGAEDTEDPYGEGLGATIFWWVFFKKSGVRFWLKFSDKFSQPTILGRYGRDAGPEDIDKLMEAMRAYANDQAIAIPEGMGMDLLEAARSVSANGFQDLVAEMDGQISEAVLGERLTTNIGDTGSRSAGEVHNEVREELVDADCDLQSAVINDTLARWLTEINLPGANPPWFSRIRPDNEDLKAKVDIEKTLHDMGYEADPEHIAEIFGGNRTFRAKQPAPPVPPTSPAPAEPASFNEPYRDGIDDLADQAGQLAGQYSDELIGEIEQIFATAGSFEEMQRRLTDLAEVIPRDQARVIAEGMITAHLTGRDDLTEGRETP